MLSTNNRESEFVFFLAFCAGLIGLTLSIIAIVYGSIILDDNVGASGHKLYLWVNCLVHIIHMALSLCETSTNKVKDKSETSMYSGCVGLGLLIWDIYIWANLSGSYDFYHVNYPDVLILFKVFSIFNFVSTGLVCMCVCGYLVSKS